MKKKTSNQQQLQISSFIKDPGSLKLLILAGTNIKHIQLSTIAKCTSLIKLDLSSNYLSELPLRFSNFSHMKILYLHDNQLTHIDIKATQLQYISLFKNPVKPSQYRKTLINSNQKLLGIDFNVITSKEKFGNRNFDNLPVYSEIKWPIVEISSNLEHQDDYLNLLKAEIFVINNVYKRTVKIQTIQRIFQGITQANRYQTSKVPRINGGFMLPSVIKAIRKWKQFTILKRKLRKILQNKGKQSLLLTQLQRNKQQRSPQVDNVIQEYMKTVRNKMKVREILQRQSRAYRGYLPAQKSLYKDYLGFSQDRDYVKNPIKLYFKHSQLDILSKVCLFTKKIFFKQKDYDLCDQFNNLFKETNRKFYILRKKEYLENQFSWLLNSIHQTSGLVLKQVGIDRKHLLYNRKGHKKIGIKNITKLKDVPKIKQKMEKNDKKIQYLFEKYDKLIEYQVSNWKILKHLIKIIRYINAGNSQSIILTQTAYFQTEVIFQQKQKLKKKVRFHVGLQFFTKRVIAANIIQRFWRRKMSKSNKINVIQIIRKKRAQNLISRWVRNIIFTHRLSSLKQRSYYSSVWKESQVYFHLDIYMNMPQPTNYLRFQQKPQNKNNFYNILHKGTQVQIVQNCGRKWLKIIYPNPKQAKQAQICLHKFTYCYSQKFYLKFFSANQINNKALLEEYQKFIPHLYKISINQLVNSISNQQKTTKVTFTVDNSEPYFIWSQVNSLQHFTKFQGKQRFNTNVSIFIYNKHKRPLKVSCEFFWVQLDSLYNNKKHKQISKQKSYSVNRNVNSSVINQANAKTLNLRQNYVSGRSNQGDLSLLQFQYAMNSGTKKNKLIYDLQAGKQRKNLLRQNKDKQRKSVDKDLSLRRNSLGSKNQSKGKNHRSRIISDGIFQKLAQTLNIRGK